MTESLTNLIRFVFFLLSLFKEFSELFYASPQGQDILERLNTPGTATDEDRELLKEVGSTKFANSRLTSLKLLAKRELLLWWRNKYQVGLFPCESDNFPVSYYFLTLAPNVNWCADWQIKAKFVQSK